MRLESAQSLKLELLKEIVEPLAARAANARTSGAAAFAVPVAGIAPDPSLFGVGARAVETVPDVYRSFALGLAPHGKGYRLAVRLQRPALRHSSILEHLTRKAKGEVDVRLIGRVDKRPVSRRVTARRQPQPEAEAGRWYQCDTRPLLIGASVSHVDVTAGTIGAFVRRGGTVGILSNNHVLANEDRGQPGDWVLQRARYDGGSQPAERVARLAHRVPLAPRGANLVDAAFAAIEGGIDYDRDRLRGIAGGKDRSLRGLGPRFVDEGTVVRKVGRTTGATRGRVTAFGLDNVVVGYDLGNLRFDDQIEIEGSGAAAFSDGGDSGSLIVDSRWQAVALLFSGSEAGGRNGQGLTYANPIHRVLEDLEAELLS